MGGKGRKQIYLHEGPVHQPRLEESGREVMHTNDLQIEPEF